MQKNKARIFKSSWCYSRFLIHFSIRKKWPILCLRIPVLQSKQVALIRSAPTYLRCIVDQIRSKYDQPMLYRRPPRCTPAQHTTCGERDHPRLFFNRLKNLSRSPRPLRAGPTNPRCILDQHTLSPMKARSLPIRQFFKSRRERGLIGSLVWTGLKGLFSTFTSFTRIQNYNKLLPLSLIFDLVIGNMCHASSKHTQQFGLYSFHKIISIFVHIEIGLLLVMVNLCVKFERRCRCLRL